METLPYLESDIPQSFIDGLPLNDGVGKLLVAEKSYSHRMGDITST